MDERLQVAIERYEKDMIGQYLTLICKRHSPEAANSEFTREVAEIAATIKRREVTASEWMQCLRRCKDDTI